VGDTSVLGEENSGATIPRELGIFFLVANGIQVRREAAGRTYSMRADNGDEGRYYDMKKWDAGKSSKKRF